ncbi:uncharacterized protein PITG_20794 [Phytophthora infestans T30-4]|uniref:Palmitoyltransferase n=1 Tax=Phytophthora infestans (strain T30-4) TaxID=403677 RepID=D0P2Q3_PHYIT|nr:uncharacterized protein PITG_20794 [Phytophthora infestans T30-4]EEY56718.1 conserved hypothetical protein [Phytophthora infestans T30-4]|eukprot:XP_002895414.1 conserved hypothetical protein [Phytophthora infestans T30-4]
MRTKGFEKPFSSDQVTSWIIQLVLIGSFITFVSTLLRWDKCLAILVPNVVLVIFVITSWGICELRDPSKPSRYCGLCFKNSPGLDHHCTWLNTCIAESNYESFYCLVVSATCQTLLQTVIGILMCTLWQSEVKTNAAEGWDKALITLIWIHNAACMSLTSSFLLLAGFHTYLLCIGMGTYDFILENGSDGLCTRMLKCNCLRRKKTWNGKRSHVQHGDVNDPGAKGVGTRTRRGSPPASIMPANLSALSSITSQTSLDRAAAAAALELTAAMQPDMILSARVNVSEGIFENFDLSSPLKPKKMMSGAVVAPAAPTTTS